MKHNKIKKSNKKRFVVVGVVISPIDSFIYEI